MSLIGAALMALSVTLVLLAFRRPSAVARRLSLVRPPISVPRPWLRLGVIDAEVLARSGLGWTVDQLALAKIVCGSAACLVAAATSVVIPIGLVIVVAAGYLGFIAPSLLVEHRHAVRQGRAESGTVSLVEWLCALVASGRPAESATIALGRRGIGDPVVDAVLRATDRSYALGGSLYPALEREARRAGLGSLVRVAERLERAREMGQGSLAVLGDLRDELRAAERGRALANAAQVEGKLTLVLTLCYLPALALLVIVPLFLTLLVGLLG